MNHSSASAVPNRWAVLALLATAQLMVVLDATIVNIALPSAQEALGFGDDSRQWIITAYALSFGSLLLGCQQEPKSASLSGTQKCSTDLGIRSGGGP